MARWIYSLVYYLALPLIVLRLLLRALKAPAYRRRIGERFAWFKSPSLRDPIWIHAVSVGETIAAEPVIRRLLETCPERDIVVTTMTPTGSERVRALFGDTVFHVYAPYDIPCAVKRFLKRVRPSLLIIMETELWPNILHYCHQQGVPTVLLNARLSAKSAIGYQNLSMLSVPMIRCLDVVIAQSQADANRFHTLGVETAKLVVSGSIKYDVTLSPALIARAQDLKASWQQRPTWVAASTHAGEDDIVLACFQTLLQQFPDLLLVLVPRHPERFKPVEQLIARQGLHFVRRSDHAAVDARTQVVLGDTMGELLLLYGVADICFVGGSLVPRGGHNMLEPAVWGRPIITGPSDYNFSEISHKLQQAGALVKVDDESALSDQLRNWLLAETARETAGVAGREMVEENQGVLDRVMAVLQRWL